MQWNELKPWLLKFIEKPIFVFKRKLPFSRQQLLKNSICWVSSRLFFIAYADYVRLHSSSFISCCQRRSTFFNLKQNKMYVRKSLVVPFSFSKRQRLAMTKVTVLITINIDEQICFPLRRSHALIETKPHFTSSPKGHGITVRTRRWKEWTPNSCIAQVWLLTKNDIHWLNAVLWQFVTTALQEIHQFWQVYIGSKLDCNLWVRKFFNHYVFESKDRKGDCKRKMSKSGSS